MTLKRRILTIKKTKKDNGEPITKPGIEKARKRCVKSVCIRSDPGPHFLSFGVSHRIQFECGKMRTRITPNTDNFQAVKAIQILDSLFSQLGEAMLNFLKDINYGDDKEELLTQILYHSIVLIFLQLN